MYSTTHLLTFVVLAFSLVCFMADDTHANGRHYGYFGRGSVGCDNYGSGNYGLGGPYEMPYAMGRIPTPPYFFPASAGALQRRRTADLRVQPFAYPGTFETPGIVGPPAEVVNPHVEPKVQAESTNHLAATPIVVRNPFVGRAQGDGVEVARSKD